MIISKTPYRISFFGGGTDYPDWYLKEGGAVLSTSIDKYSYISCRILPPFSQTKYRIVWSHIENVSTINEILHPTIREGLKYFGVNGKYGGMEIHHQGDLPDRSGMGSSSSFAVGFIRAIASLNGQILGNHELALKAIEFEQTVLKESVGSQDQIAAAYGGFNVIRFYQNGDIKVEPVTISAPKIRELESHLMMIYTGTSRLSSELASDIISNLHNKKNVLYKMHSFVDRAIEILNNSECSHDFGELLHETWILKQSLSKNISNSSIKKIYQTALANGAIGGKLLGAGSSGFMIFYVPLDKQKQVKDALQGFLHIPFKFERQGCTIIHYNDTDTYSDSIYTSPKSN